MYDSKVVRRRRAVLAVFVVLSIAILTAYFGESGGGFFHTLQRGAQEGVAPIETGASRALTGVEKRAVEEACLSAGRAPGLPDRGADGGSDRRGAVCGGSRSAGWW